MQALIAGFGRPGGRPTFRIGSIPVRVELSFWVMAVILGMFGDVSSIKGPELAVWVAVVFVSILLHELGHALAYMMRGARAEILLYGGGGLTFGRRDRGFSNGERIFTALAGPLAGMIFAGVLYAFGHFHGPFATPLAKFAMVQLLFVNFGWGIFNLLPVLPMDGGHVLESLLCAKDQVRGRVWARYVSIGFCLVLTPICYLYFGPIAAMFLVLFALQSFQTLSLVDPKRQAQLQQRAVVVPAPPAEAPDVIENLGRLHKLLAEDKPEQARAVAHQVLSAAHGFGARDQALRALAWIAIANGNPTEALEHLGKASPHFDDPLTIGTALAAAGDAEHALPHLERAYRRSPDPQSVATYGRCLVAVGRVQEARQLAGFEAPVEVQRALGEALFRSRDYAGAADISRRIFDRAHQPIDAYNLACAESRQGRAEAAMLWLRTAIDAGFNDRAHLEEDPDLEPLHASAEWGELLSRVPVAAT